MPRPFIRLVFAFNMHKDQILNYFKHHLDNAKVEGAKNKIKTLKRQAYSYRVILYFKPRLYHPR